MINFNSVNELVDFHTKGITPIYTSKSNLIVLNQKCIRDNQINYSLAQYCKETQKFSQNKIIKKGDLLVNSTGQGTAGRVAFVENVPDNIKVVIDSHILLLRFKSYETARCVNYLLHSFENDLKGFLDGSTGQGELDKIMLFNTLIPLSNSKDVKKEAISLLELIDTKIKINLKITKQLSHISNYIYDYWLNLFQFPDVLGKPYKSSGGPMLWNIKLKREIPNDWEIKTLLDIANFQNGIPCQKFRPKKNEDFLRVIKIKEMHDGFSKNTEFVKKDVPQKIIVNNGDILFSWSASLSTKIWSGGVGALNQHIFKVTSNEYPKFFYFFELNRYLNHFKMMAENRKTTMGHITQEHLQQSKILTPSKDLIDKLDVIIDPLLEKIIHCEKENTTLLNLRNWLMPFLINGHAITV